MDSNEFTFLSCPINLSKCKGAVLKPVRELDPSECFSSLILKSRQVLFEFTGQLAAWPSPDSGTIFVICEESLLTSDKMTGLIRRLQLVLTCLTQPGPHLVDCVTYTLKALLAPHWNTVGDWLLAGRQFLHNVNPLPAVKMRVNVTGDQLEITLKANNVSFPLLKPDDLGLDPRLIDAFVHADKDAEMTEKDFGRQYVVVLPKLTRARLVSVIKCLPQESRFSDWPAMRRYWKNMYGYRLQSDGQGEDKGEPVVYYNVSFFGKTQLTYPEWTVRSFSPRPIPRSDPKPICEKFLQDLVRLNKTICGERFSIRRAPVVLNPPFLQSSSVDNSVNLDWPTKTGCPPYRDVASKPKDHSPVWKDTLLPVPASTQGVEGTSPFREIQDDSGYGTGTEDTSMIYSKSSEKIKPVFKSRDVKIVTGNKLVVEQKDQAKPGPGIKPNFLSKLLSSRSPAAASQTDESAKKNVVPKCAMTNPTSSASRVNMLPHATNTSVSRPLFSVDFSKLRASGAEDVRAVPKPKINLVTNKVAPKETAVKKNLISSEDIANLVSSNRLKDLSKVNVPSLLAYCRRVGIKEARAKSKKEELVNWILIHHKVGPT